MCALLHGAVCTQFELIKISCWSVATCFKSDGILFLPRRKVHLWPHMRALGDCSGRLVWSHIARRLLSFSLRLNFAIEYNRNRGPRARMITLSGHVLETYLSCQTQMRTMVREHVLPKHRRRTVSSQTAILQQLTEASFWIHRVSTLILPI